MWRRRRVVLACGALPRNRSSSSRHSSRVTLAHRGAGARSSGWRRVFFLFAATLSCGLWRYSGVMFFLLSAISWPWHATLERMSANTAVLAQELRRPAESWRSAAASSARWIGSRRSPKLRSSAVARAIGLIFCLADALRGFGRRGGPLRTGVLSRSNSRRSLAADVRERQNTNSLRGLP